MGEDKGLSSPLLDGEEDIPSLLLPDKIWCVLLATMPKFVLLAFPDESNFSAPTCEDKINTHICLQEKFVK